MEKEKFKRFKKLEQIGFAAAFLALFIGVAALSILFVLSLMQSMVY